MQGSPARCYVPAPLTVNLQKYVKLYAEVSTSMEHRKLVVDRVRLEH